MMRPMKLSGENFIFGKGCLAHLETLKGKKAVLYYTNSSKRNGNLAKIINHLTKANISVIPILFNIIEPSFEDVFEGSEILHQETPDWIIAIGGGSILDASKAMWIIYEHPEIDTIQKMMSYHNNMLPMRNKARLVCIPTTSGTASEVSRSLVVTDKDTNVKYGVSDLQLLADIAILDPELTVTLPPKMTAETSMDALTHSIEAFVSQRSNILSDVLTKNSFLLVYESLKTVYNNPQDIEGREKLLLASAMSGMGFSNVSLGIVHSISHTIGGRFKLAHGLLNAIILPYVVEFNSQSLEAFIKYQDLSKAIQSDDLCKSLKQLSKEVGIPESLEGLVDKDIVILELDTLVNTSLNDGCTKTNPKIPTKEEMKNLILKICNI